MKKPTNLPHVLAVEPDPRQGALLKRVLADGINAELILVESRDAAIAALSARVPDVILLTALLSPRDEAEMLAHLRTLEGADHVQTHTIPQLASGSPDRTETPGVQERLLGKFRRKKEAQEPPSGCDPALFADEVRVFLARAAELKAHAAAAPQPRESVKKNAKKRSAVQDEDAGTPAQGADGEALAGSAWSSPFEWRKAEPVNGPAPKTARRSLVTSVPLAVIAEEQEHRGNLEAEAVAKQEAERKRLEAEAAAKQEAERKRLEAEAAAKQEAERKRLEAEAAAKREAERKRLEAEAAAKREAERKRLEAEAAAKREAERQRLEAEAAAKREAERKRLEAEAAAKREAERKRLEAEAAAKREAERKRLEAEAAAKREAERQRLEAEAAAKREAERKRLEAEAAAKREAERKRLEAEAAAKREAERKRLEAEAAAKREAERKRLEAEAAAKQEAERKRLEAEAAAKREAERKRLEAEAAARENAYLEAEAAAERKRIETAAAEQKQREKREAAAQQRQRLEAEAAERRDQERVAREEADRAAAATLEPDPDAFADFREDAPSLLGLIPLSLWARRDVSDVPAPARNADDLRQLFEGLALPPDVAGVSYARGCRIRRVRVAASGAPPHAKGPVIISKRALDEIRAGN